MLNIDLSQFKPIPNTNGNYLIGKDGTVVSFQRPKRSRIIGLDFKGNQSEKVSIRVNGKAKSFYVLRLMAMTFFPEEYTNDCMVYSKDGDQTNFSLDNIIIGDYESRNTLRRSKPVVQLSIDGKKLARFDSIKDAAASIDAKRYPTALGCIKNYLSGLCRTACGYKWVHEENYKEKVS